MKIVLVTAPADAADRIAETLVAERLAACVSRIPGVTSVYRWQGEVERSTEVQLVVKTRDEALSRVMQRIQGLHPYDVPEIVALDVVAASIAYAQWVADSTNA